MRDKLGAWVRDTYNHITSVVELSVELQQLRHCLACVARQCSLQLADALPQVGVPHLFGAWLGSSCAPAHAFLFCFGPIQILYGDLSSCGGEAC